MDGRRKALIVASDEYEHEGLRDLLSPAADADALAGVLHDPQIGDFDVDVVRNEPSHVVEGQIEDLFAEGRPDDVLLLHFSCHGLKSESGELFFAARNTRPNRLGSTAISADFVQRCMRASRSRSIVLLLDCCYGGAFGQGVAVRASGDVNVLDSFPGGQLGGGRGRAVITASSSMEYAFEGDHLADDHGRRPSVFTAALVEGLATGEADRDEDGWVSLNELYDYVFDRVRAQNPYQTPSRDVEMQGELYLARSRRQRIRALPIPPDLLAATTDPNMFTRLGAVSELRSRQASGNLPAAAGAHAALADMARTDIQYVAEAAAAALREAVVQVEERELQFGQVAAGSSPAHRTVHLLGPPLARACTFQASHSWIQIDETADGLDVSVDTSAAGRLHGDITLKGPTGEAVIPVDVEVTPRPEQAQPPAPAPPAPVPAVPEPPRAPAPAAPAPAVPEPPPAAVPTAAAPAAAAPAATAPLRTASDGLLVPVAGQLAIVAALLLVLGPIPNVGGTDDSAWYLLIMAGVVFTAGVCMQIRRTRRWVGPGLLLGAVAASIGALVYLVGYWLKEDGSSLNIDYWLGLTAHVLLVVAACLAGIALGRDPEVGLPRRPPQGGLPWLVALLGAAGALALLFHARNLWQAGLRLEAVTAIWAILTALLVPACAAVAVPRRFGVSVLAGWIGGGAAYFADSYVFLYRKLHEDSWDIGSGPMIMFGLTLLALVVVAAFFARAAPGAPLSQARSASGSG